MSAYFCIAMLEDPPFSIILATTNEPTDWLNKLPLPSHLILCELFSDASKVRKNIINTLKDEGIAALSNKAFSAQIHEVLDVYLRVRDEEKFGKNTDQISDNEIAEADWPSSKTKQNNKPQSEAEKYFELAEQYDNGNGVELDREKAKDFYLKAAGNDHAEAKYRLGNIYAPLKYDNNRNFNSEAYRQSESWYRLAAEQGHIPAQSHMAYMADTYKQGERWYNKIRKAAEKGNAEAQYELGRDYQIGFSILNDGFRIDENEELANFWYLKAAKSYQKLAEQGDPIAQIKLAGMYSREKGVEYDQEESVFWYRLAADQGHPEALFWLGWHYQKGSGVDQNNKEAARYYRQAAEKGDSSAQFALFEAFTLGRGVKQDYEQAANWCHKAADRGRPTAKIHLANLYLEGRGVERDEKLSEYWLRKVAEISLTDYNFSSVAKPYDENNDLVPLTPSILFKWAQFYTDGVGLAQDHEQALYWYQEAADRGFAPAQCRLASMYLSGAHVDQNDQEAIAWFKKAAEQGDVVGQYNLAVMCFKGRGINQDKEQAIYWCKKAASQGHQAAQEALSKLGLDWS